MVLPCIRATRDDGPGDTGEEGRLIPELWQEDGGGRLHCSQGIGS